MALLEEAANLGHEYTGGFDGLPSLSIAPLYGVFEFNPLYSNTQYLYALAVLFMLFVILRSSHEKFTRALMLFCLFLLVRSINLSDQRHRFAIYVGLFYVSTFALIASNSYIAHSFVFALAIALLVGHILRKRNAYLQRPDDRTLTRLPYVLLISIAGFYLFIFYIYPPAMHQISVYETIWDRLAALLLNTEVSTPTNAYAAVSTGWISIYVYFLVSLANWIILLTSFTIWSYQGIRWFWRKETPGTQTSLLIWFMYAAFAGTPRLTWRA
jgi:hypothetical protein